MALVPFLAMMMGILSCLIYYGGGETVYFVPFAITLLLAIAGAVVGVSERPVSSRISSLLAAVLGALPLLAPFVIEWRLSQMAAQRAVETRPMYARLDAMEEELAAPIRAYYEQHGLLPDYNGEELLPFFNDQGNLHERPPMPPEFSVPQDPFAPARPMRLVAVRDAGVMLVSVGQDGVAEMPLPGFWLDGPPNAHPLAPMAAVGTDTRPVTYDPTNGALGLGDVVRWVGVGQTPEGEYWEYERAMDLLFAAWDKAEQVSPFAPTQGLQPTQIDPNPQSARDNRAAEELLRNDQPLAALALASRALRERHPYPKQWADADWTVNRTRGVALYHLGSFREAADALISYTSRNPNDVVGHYYLGAALFYGKNRGEAEKHLRIAAQIDPQSSMRHDAQARLDEIQAGQQPNFPVPLTLRPAQPAAGESAFPQ